MRIESVDFYFLAMPEILDIGDGSQDLTLVWENTCVPASLPPKNSSSLSGTGGDGLVQVMGVMR